VYWTQGVGAALGGRVPEAGEDLEAARQLVDGPRFVDMLAANGVLLQVGKFGELKRQK